MGTVVGVTALATDADGTDSVSYSLDDDAGGLFAIDSTTGVVTVNGAIDREASSSYNITVRATSTDTSTTTQVFNIAIGDVDEYDVGAVSDSNAAANTVAENATIGTTVGVTVSAQDLDATNNTITYTLDDDAGGLFTIHATTGVVTVNGALDYETATSHNITARATSSDGSFNTQAFTINVTDVNESSVSAISDSDAAADFVLENVSVGTVVGVTALATDADGTDTVSYSLDDDAGGLFAIDSTTGVVTVNGAIDREAASSYNITVRATSTDTSTTTQVFNIAIGDVDEYDVGAVSDSNAAANTVAENATIGTTVGITVSAQDLDATNNTITYTLDDDAGGLFTIHATTGVVTVNGALDYETATSHNITARATSSDGSFNTQVFTINVTDFNEFSVSAISDSDGAVNAVAEDAANGVVVGLTALASDADGTNNIITYSLDDSASGRFAIDSSTGIVTLADSSLLDFETSASHNITVRADSSDGSFQTQVFTISVIDRNDAPIITSNGGGSIAFVNAAEGSLVATTVVAQDADLPADVLTFSIIGGADAGRFEIDSSSGQLRFKVAPNYEVPHDANGDGIHDVIVRVSDGRGGVDEQTIHVTVTNANDTPIAGADGDFQTDQLSSLTVSSPSLLANDSDEDGDPLTAVLVANAQHGSLTLNADGSFVYTPNAGFSGTDQFQYAASDGTMLSAPVTINITVTLVAPGAPASAPTKSASDVEKSPQSNSQDKAQPKVITTVAPSIAVVPAAVTTDAPVGAVSSALGIAYLPSEPPEPPEPPEPAASRDMSERSEQPERPDLSFAINVLEDALRSTTRRLAESAARPIHYTSFGLIADTVLTLAFDSSDGGGDGLAWQKELQTRQLIVGTAAAVTSSLSVGYVVWMLRGGTVVASFMSSIPAWCSFDPLPIVDSFENAHANKGRSPVDESLASIAGPHSSTTTTDS
ncbi:MAG: cadherin domain-containing protein [Pirellulaceae bacterium]|nr:cadherin domain-containing protein [Pirellulaceae bacterium]